MRADYKGEGGIFALLALLGGEEPPSRRLRLPFFMLLLMFGAALLYGDGCITSAISVLSAGEGLEGFAPRPRLQWSTRARRCYLPPWDGSRRLSVALKSRFFTQTFWNGDPRLRTMTGLSPISFWIFTDQAGWKIIEGRSLEQGWIAARLMSREHTICLPARACAATVAMTAA
jgi:hypothetical protein